MNSYTYNFYPQTGLNFLTSFNILNNFSYASFTLLGASGNASIILESGLIKNTDNEFLSSFNKLGNVSISGNLSRNNFNFFIDEKLIYIENKNYGNCTGVQFKTADSGIYNSLSLSIYGDRPSYFIGNEGEVYSEQPISCFISGDSSNARDFNIYSIDIGGTLDANLGNFSYVPRNFFQISGQSSWQDGLKISPGGVHKFIINQTRLFDTAGGYTYIPIYIETEFGTIYKRLFVRITSQEAVEKLLFKIDATKIVDDGPDNIIFTAKAAFQSPSSDNKNFLIYLSGLNGNNYSFNNYIDTFTGSWGISSPDIDFYPKILNSGNLSIFDSTNNLNNLILKSGIYYNFVTGSSGQFTGVSGISENQIPINTGFYNGIMFDVPYVYNASFKVTGIDFGIYSLGNFSGARNSTINTAISGGRIGISIYEVDNTYRLKNLIGSSNIIVSNISDTGINSGNIYKISEMSGKYNLYVDKKYALILTGNSSARHYGYNLFLPTGNTDYTTNYIENIYSISGLVSEIGQYPAITGINKIPFIRIMGVYVTDDNILIGSGSLNVSNQNINYINIYKIYEFNGSDSFTGSAMFYISGYSGFQKSGTLSVYKNLYREIEQNIQIF
jgi:hypothetical protein